MKITLALPVITLVLLTSFRAVATEREKPEAVITYKIADAIIVRPIGFVATIAGGALYFVTWPVSRTSGSHHDMYNTLVRQPSELAFGNRTPQSKELPLIAQKEVPPTPRKTAKK